jgi:ethanolamine utilization protein EutA
MESIVSVGIDVGTTSTHLAFTRMSLGNRSRINEPTRLAVTQRETIYQSEIYRTPLIDEDVIDAVRVVEIIRSEYKKANIRAEDIATGAVIITGETAKKRNAEDIVDELSKLAGNFVAASAGPNLESALAARGSGACAASLDGKVICNVDVGGGTTNIAICENGVVVDCRWLAVGGRVCTTDSVDEDARRVIALAGAVLPRRPQVSGPVELWFSGGVAEIMLRLKNNEVVDDTEFGDCGVLLARALLRQLKRPIFIPPNPIRATVIGAGAHSLQLSGSTVAVENTSLPIRNLPIVRVSGPDEIEARMKLHDLDWSKQEVAIMMVGLPRIGYVELKKLAEDVWACFRDANGKAPLVVLVEQDLAAALGQLLVGASACTTFAAAIGDKNVQAARDGTRRASSPPLQTSAAASEAPEIIVLDGIATEYGDYIDIGKPMANGQFVPVVIKELIFAPSCSTAAVEA